jgi:hypothetical protein
MKKALILAIAIAAVLAFVGCNKKAQLPSQSYIGEWHSHENAPDVLKILDITDGTINFILDLHRNYSAAGTARIENNKIVFVTDNDKSGTMQFNENGISLTIDGVEYDFIIKQTDAQTAMPSQDYVGTWGDEPEYSYIKIWNIFADDVDFNWYIIRRVSARGTARVDGNRIAFFAISGDDNEDDYEARISGTMEFSVNGITLAVEESNHPMINAGAKYNYPVKASGGITEAAEDGDQIWQLNGHSNNSNITATWSRGTLTISGTGAIGGNYISGKYPWKDPLLEVYRLVIGNGITEIGNWAFEQKQLETVSFPNSVITIGDGAFYKNQLTSVVIPNSVTTIGDTAFADNQLTSVTIPNSVTVIGYAAFNNNKLTSITIPNHITTIEAGTFMDNPLTSITIGANVTFNEGPGELQWAFPGTFDDAYNNNGKQAGTYTSYDGGETWAVG